MGYFASGIYNHQLNQQKNLGIKLAVYHVRLQNFFFVDYSSAGRGQYRVLQSSLGCIASSLAGFYTLTLFYKTFENSVVSPTEPVLSVSLSS